MCATDIPWPWTQWDSGNTRILKSLQSDRRDLPGWQGGADKKEVLKNNTPLLQAGYEPGEA